LLSLVLVSEDHAGHRAVARRINDLACDTKGDPSARLASPFTGGAAMLTTFATFGDATKMH